MGALKRIKKFDILRDKKLIFCEGFQSTKRFRWGTSGSELTRFVYPPSPPGN